MGSDKIAITETGLPVPLVRAVTGDDGFFREACLVDKPAAEKSPDPRYCQVCYDFLLGEAEMLGSGKHTRWVPSAPQKPVSKPVSPAYGVSQNYIGTQGRFWNCVHCRKQKNGSFRPSNRRKA